MLTYRDVPLAEAAPGDWIHWIATGGIHMSKQIEGRDGERFAMSGGWSHMHPDTIRKLPGVMIRRAGA